MAARTATSTQQQTQHLTVAELARRWNCTTDHLYRDVIGQTNGISPIRIGRGERGRLRIPLSEVERYEEENRVRYGVIERKKK